MKKSGKTAKGGYLVFISHSTEDRWIARQMAQLIERKGKRHQIKTFLDEKDIEGGQSIPEVILNNLEECDEFLVLLSPYSINRSWVLVEIGGAWSLRKLTVAIMDKIKPDDLPKVSAQYKAIDLNVFDEYLEQLLRRVKEVKSKYETKGKTQAGVAHLSQLRLSRPGTCTEIIAGASFSLAQSADLYP